MVGSKHLFKSYMKYINSFIQYKDFKNRGHRTKVFYFDCKYLFKQEQVMFNLATDIKIVILLYNIKISQRNKK